jgi:hypothetical protein
MNIARTFGFAILLVVAGSASADEGALPSGIYSDHESLHAKVHHLGYQGVVDTINKPQPFADSTGGLSKAVADAFGKSPGVLSVQGIEVISVVVQPDVN